MNKTPLLLLNIMLLMAVCATAQVFTPIDVRSGSPASNPRQFVAYNSKTYFVATGDAATGPELWVTDGTQAGTTLVKDIAPGTAGSGVYRMSVYAGKIYFAADDGVHGFELWVSDGTTAGTVMIADLNAGVDDAYPSNMTEYGGKVYFSATSTGKGDELWVTDGTTAGTVLVKDINPGAGGSSIQAFKKVNSELKSSFNEYNGKLYFRADDGVHGSELWMTDGTSAGTMMVADVWPGPGEGIPFLMTPLNGRMIFTAQDSIHGLELWTSDGTAAGTALLKDVNPGGLSSSAASTSGYTEFNGKLYFCAYQDATGFELWSTDGTSAGTTLVKDIWAGPGDSRAGGDYTITIFNNKLYFAAKDSLNGEQLWSSDGTTAGTLLAKVISPVIPGAAEPRGLIVYNGQLIFTAETDGVNGRQLYTSDGSAAGTHVISPAIAPNPDPLVLNINGIPLAVCNGALYMNANFNSIGYEVWTYSAAATSVIERNMPNVLVFPNPVTSSLHLSGLEPGTDYTMQITDATGRQCYIEKIRAVQEGNSINLSALSQGMYLMQISGPESNQIVKLIKN